jgi:hypothetical protein
MQKPKTAFTFLLHSIKPFKFYVGLHLFVVLYNAIDLSLWPYVSKILVDKLAATPHENIMALSQIKFVISPVQHHQCWEGFFIIS